jgi:hypothetical protein
MTLTIPAGTPVLDVIRDIGIDVRIEWPPEPIPTERELLGRRLLNALSWHLIDRWEAENRL